MYRVTIDGLHEGDSSFSVSFEGKQLDQLLVAALTSASWGVDELLGEVLPRVVVSLSNTSVMGEMPPWDGYRESHDKMVEGAMDLVMIWDKFHDQIACGNNDPIKTTPPQD